MRDARPAYDCDGLDSRLFGMTAQQDITRAASIQFALEGTMDQPTHQLEAEQANATGTRNMKADQSPLAAEYLRIWKLRILPGLEGPIRLKRSAEAQPYQERASRRRTRSLPK